MAIVDCQPFFYPMELRAVNVSGLPVNNLIDAAGEQRAVILRAPQAGTITGFDFYSGSTVTTSGDVDGRAETIDQTTGFPTGTLFSANANGTVTVSAANTWYSVTFTTAISVTKGQELAFVISNTTGNYNILGYGGFAQPGYPYAPDKVSGAWAKGGSGPVLALNYGGTYYPVAFVSLATATISVNTGSTPDEVGNLFTLPFGARMTGVTAMADFDGDCDLVLYDAANTVLATVSLDKDVRGGSGAGGVVLRFSSPVTLSANTSYRLVFKPSTTTGSAVRYWDCGTAARRGATPGGLDFQYTARTDAGAWTETDTKQTLIYPQFDGIDVGAGIARLIGDGMVS